MPRSKPGYPKSYTIRVDDLFEKRLALATAGTGLGASAWLRRVVDDAARDVLQRTSSPEQLAARMARLFPAGHDAARVVAEVCGDEGDGDGGGAAPPRGGRAVSKWGSYEAAEAAIEAGRDSLANYESAEDLPFRKWTFARGGTADPELPAILRRLDNLDLNRG